MSRYRSLFLAALLVVAAAASLAGQGLAQPAGIVGRVVDERTGQPLPDVTVQVVGQEVVGTRLATYTGANGRYRLVDVRPGTVTLVVRRIGYSPRNVTGIYLEAGKVIEQDVALTPGSTQLAAIVVSADRERATVAQALEAQRLAPGVVSGINREAIQKGPDGDAAQAARRVSGLAIADDKTVNARGLSGRYTTTSLNGARLPSPDPERKAVPLDLFPSNLLDGITVAKSFTPDQPGDFAGAMVQITTREFPADRIASYSLGVGMNSAWSGRTLPVATGVGGESFALAGSGRGLPSVVRAGGDLANTTWPQRNSMINAFRKSWQAGDGGALPNGSMSVTLGGNELVAGHRVGYVASGSYSLTHDVRLDETRALGRVGDAPGSFVPYNVFSGTSAGTSALWGGILNLSSLLGPHVQLRLNNTYTRTADHEARTERGVYEDLGLPLSVQVMDYVQRSAWSSQLVVEREVDGDKLKFSATGARVTRAQPDRSEFVQEVRDSAGVESLLWMNSHPEGAVRTFADLVEHSIETGLDWQHGLGPAGGSRLLKFGALGRVVHRDADTRSYSIFSSSMTDVERALPPEVIFGGQFTQPSSQVLQLRPLSQGGSYSAADYLGAAYGMFDASLGDRWRVTAGARFERSSLRVRATSTLGQPSSTTRSFGDVLPSVALTFSPTDQQNLRLSASRTLARPEYREVAPLLYRNVVADKNTVGNPELVRTLIDNADVRWEYYPERGELLSVGLFAKRFHDPIEAVAIASSAANGLETFLNARAGTDLGLELEARRNLGTLSGALEPLTAFGNITVMRSRIDLGDAQTAATTPRRAMVGQAPYIVNAGLTYAVGAEDASSATLLFNRMAARIRSAGESPLPDVVEDARTTLDLSLRFPLLRGMTGRIDARNLLDAPVTERQGTVIRHQYWAGRVFQAGITWR